jgi:hypothetical protein
MNGSFTPEDKLRMSKDCANWFDIVKGFELFPPPKVQYDSEVGVIETAWIFRGHPTDYALEPTIERVSKQKAVSWAELEWRALKEFRSKARMHLAPSLLPPWDKKLDWLALMRHYGVPTRLLDFTFSPYIALYFALRNRTEEEKSKPAEVWAINAVALRGKAAPISHGADREEDKYQAEKEGRPYTQQCTSFDPRGAFSDVDVLQAEYEDWERLTAKALAPSQIRAGCFNEKGFVALASPPVESPRLSSQQGVFLFNGAEKFNFQDSLFTMMGDHVGDWCRLFRISPAAAPESEEKLFQMNIHDLSLFPDIEGLAGFIRQKSRLHWFPKDSQQ